MKIRILLFLILLGLKWNNEAFTNLYASRMKADGTMEAPEKFTKTLNTIYNESSAVFTRDGVECSEAEHQQNRRSQFIVLAM